MKKRPFGVTLLAIFALFSALAAGYHTLQMLHLLPFRIGDYRFFGFDLFGAIMWGLMFFIYLWVFRMLWNLDPQGWLFVVVIATLNLILAFVSILGQTTFADMAVSIVLNAIVLIYALTPGVKNAFAIPASTKKTA
jgi:hypothetical protein